MMVSASSALSSTSLRKTCVRSCSWRVASQSAAQNKAPTTTKTIVKNHGWRRGLMAAGSILASIVTYSRRRFFPISGALALHALDRQWLEQLRQIALSEQRLLASDRAAVQIG